MVKHWQVELNDALLYHNRFVMLRITTKTVSNIRHQLSYLPDAMISKICKKLKPRDRLVSCQQNKTAKLIRLTALFWLCLSLLSNCGILVSFILLKSSTRYKIIRNIHKTLWGIPLHHKNTIIYVCLKARLSWWWSIDKQIKKRVAKENKSV